MANLRKPAEVAAITGAAAKNPQRYRDWSNPETAELGPPPKYLDRAQAKAWRAIASEIPWLTASDRMSVEMTARLRARVHEDPEIGLNAMALYRQCYKDLGATPVDRSKIPSSNGPTADPASEFLN